MRSQNRRARLRSATTKAHARLDGLVESAGFFDNHDAYVRYLDATWRLRAPIEAALVRWGAESLYPLWPRRCIASELRADFEDVSAIARLPTDRLADAQPVCGAAQALGVLYVLEGSALGASILVGRAGALGFNATFGARHLAAQTGIPRAWPEFLSVLEATSLDTVQETACVRAAVDVFELFENAYQAVSAG